MKTVGILGAGQLAQLLAHSAYQLGLKTCCFAHSKDVPAARLSPLFIGDLNDQKALSDFAAQCDVITVETENIPTTALTSLPQQKPFFPNVNAVNIAQDRLLEKQLLTELDIATSQFVAIDHEADLHHAIVKLGLPAILKTRRMGYDGKGQFYITDAAQITAAWQAIGQQPAILESVVNFSIEVSIIATRYLSGVVTYYPLVHNIHQSGILRESHFPFSNTNLQQQAEQAIKRLLTQLDYVGVLTLELFVVDDTIVANEIAPRVHNSGHITIETTQCSQFESHLRAITDLPPIPPKVLQSGVMYNMIGQLQPIDALVSNTTLHYYNYGKQASPGRKLGHYVLC